LVATNKHREGTEQATDQQLNFQTVDKWGHCFFVVTQRLLPLALNFLPRSNLEANAVFKADRKRHLYHCT